jgi:shikimate dehydrogenase
MNRAYAEVIGDPIEQSKSPAIHSFWLKHLGIDAEYRAEHVTPARLGDYLSSRRMDPDWRGCNVTMPHKQEVIAYLDQLDPLAARIGAVNTIIPEGGVLIGYNTDAPGFLEPLQPMLADTHLFRMARVLGTGGAARAIVSALAQQGMVIVLAGRDPAKARALLDELAPPSEGSAIEHHAVDIAVFMRPTDFAFEDREHCFDLVVNASLLGMVGQPPLKFDWTHAPPRSVVYDIVTSPLDTAFLKAGRQAGFRTVDGLAMLIGQADHAFRRFFGAKPPRNADGALREKLGV